MLATWWRRMSRSSHDRSLFVLSYLPWSVPGQDVWKILKGIKCGYVWIDSARYALLTMYTFHSQKWMHRTPKYYAWEII